MNLKDFLHIGLGLGLDPTAAAADWQLREALQTSNLLPKGSRIAEEYPLANGVRADVVAIGRELVGYEIKAGRDTLKRLPKQIEGYNQICARVHVVTVPAHLDEVLRMTPAWWGVVIPTGGAFELCLHQVRQAMPNPHRNSTAICSLLTRQELIVKLTQLRAGLGAAELPKAELVRRVARRLLDHEADAYLCQCLKARLKVGATQDELDPEVDWDMVRRNFGLPPRQSQPPSAASFA